jgi:hypothetical protein
LSGIPVFAGTRVPVQTLIDYQDAVAAKGGSEGPGARAKRAVLLAMSIEGYGGQREGTSGEQDGANRRSRRMGGQRPHHRLMRGSTSWALYARARTKTISQVNSSR